MRPGLPPSPQRAASSLPGAPPPPPAHQAHGKGERARAHARADGSKLHLTVSRMAPGLLCPAPRMLPRTRSASSAGAGAAAVRSRPAAAAADTLLLAERDVGHWCIKEVR